ncbi:universal stress protein [Schlesneria sp. DSM 10557]|uniref:universal stress protein n=1 Tax=Schlesneria sp. DSM 10557 TaxID=3044399 RepID=UPI0035A10BD2
MKIAIRRILFPTDFSAPAKEAQLYAMSLADRFGAELHLLHVVPLVIPYPDASFPWVVPEKEMQLQVDAAQQHLVKELDPEWAKDHTVVYKAVMGLAVDEILGYVKEHEIDLIVVGTHGHSGLARMLIGSVAEKLVRTSSCPVLTVHPTGHQFVIESPEERASKRPS